LVISIGCTCIQCLNCEKKEVAEHWKRGGMNAEGVRIDGDGNGEGCSPPQPTRGSGECRELTQRGPGQSPGRNRIWCILWPL